MAMLLSPARSAAAAVGIVVGASVLWDVAAVASVLLVFDAPLAVQSGYVSGCEGKPGVEIG
jgi:hypothetical protein